MKSLLVLTFALSMTACNAYRAAPESEINFSKAGLIKKGFLLTPIADNDAKTQSSEADLNEYDTILASTLSEQWPGSNLVAASDITATFGTPFVEKWRSDVKVEDQSLGSPSSVKVLEQLAEKGLSAPDQILIPNIVMNVVSCGHKEALSTNLSPNPHGARSYCQRIMKMRFRIVDKDKPEPLWNGLIYSTQETSSPESTNPEAPMPEAPPTPALIRECFTNFAKQFTDTKRPL